MHRRQRYKVCLHSEQDFVCLYHKNLTSITGGNIGITMSYFGSGPAGGPSMSWESPMSYPAINGSTLYENLTFAWFQNNCGRRHRAIMTNSWVGDILHPMDVRGWICLLLHNSADRLNFRKLQRETPKRSLLLCK